MRFGKEVPRRPENTAPATLAEGIAVKQPGRLTGRIVASLVDDVVLVSEREMLDAIGSLQSRLGIQAEPAGAASVARPASTSSGMFP